MRVDIFGIKKCKVTFGLKYSLTTDHPKQTPITLLIYVQSDL